MLSGQCSCVSDVRESIVKKLVGLEYALDESVLDSDIGEAILDLIPVELPIFRLRFKIETNPKDDLYTNDKAEFFFHLHLVYRYKEHCCWR